MSEVKINSLSIPVKFTPSALKEISRLAQKETGKVLHIGAKTGGCSGYTYVFEFVENSDKFLSYTLNNLNIAIKAEDLQYIENLEIDYEDGLNNRGFTFNNPNSSETCGCGTSFA